MKPETIDKIKAHYNHAKEKHPKFCDMMTCLSEDGANAHLHIYRATLEAEIKARAVEASTILECEHCEVIQAYKRGDNAAAIEECYDAIAVLLRMIDMIEKEESNDKH